MTIVMVTIATPSMILTAPGFAVELSAAPNVPATRLLSPSKVTSAFSAVQLRLPELNLTSKDVWERVWRN